MEEDLNDLWAKHVATCLSILLGYDYKWKISIVYENGPVNPNLGTISSWIDGLGSTKSVSFEKGNK